MNNQRAVIGGSIEIALNSRSIMGHPWRSIDIPYGYDEFYNNYPYDIQCLAQNFDAGVVNII